jgi:glycosyltransferase involved in cell wall biosynthesis
MKLCVVIPIYNECETIGMVVDSVRLKGIDVVVINDGSTDASGEVAQEHGATVIHNPVKSGKGSSLRRGFQYILEKGYDGVIAMDGDGQHDADDIEKFFRLAETYPCSIVNGSRMADVKGMPFIRLVTNKFMSWMISRVCRQRIPDTQCGYRYISAEILRAISLKAAEYEIETEVLIKASRAGFSIYSVPVRTIYSNEKSNIHPVKDTFRFFRYFLNELRQK